MPCGPSAEFPAETPAQMRARIRELETQLAEARKGVDLAEMGRHIRDAALEEAAKEARRYGLRGDEIAVAIRALKTVTPPTGGE